MAIDGETAAVALVEAWEHLLSSTPGWWVRRTQGAVAGVTKVPLATLNGVWVSDEQIDAAAIGALLDRVADTRVPHCLQVRPASARAAQEIASGSGMTPDESIPLMVLDGPGGLKEDGPRELVVQALSPEEGSRHASLAAAGFGAPEEYFLALLTAEVLHLPGLRTYIGEVDGELVSTGLGFAFGDAVGIFNVATPGAYRGRGYGSAITVRAIQDGFRSGARWAWLQSSTLGLPVYERLGFRTVESWPCWIKSG